MNIFRELIDNENYFTVQYYVESSDDSNLREVAWNIAIGQSVGNPNVRNKWETEELFENHSCMIVGNEEELKSLKAGEITIAFPAINTDWETDGISHLLCQIMGGQLDINIVKKCHVNKISFPLYVKKSFLGPKFGISGIRSYTKSHFEPLLGGIVKPKTGISPDVLFDMVKEMVDGGVNFIKEDEILSNPYFCKLEERLPKIADYCNDHRVVYCACINSDSPFALERVKLVHKLGGNGVHINFWSGLGIYRAIRELDLPIFIHFQKSGDKILTNKNHDFHIKWKVLCDLAGMSGVDFIHAGMWGGYLSETEEELRECIDVLHHHGVMPALSCGMHPGLVDATEMRFGTNWMANVGGGIHGHPGGTLAGVKAMRQAISRSYGPEYEQAIEKWGKHE
jgi:ribulose-bisphosphate carboxylase large chain